MVGSKESIHKHTYLTLINTNDSPAGCSSWSRCHPSNLTAARDWPLRHAQKGYSDNIPRLDTLQTPRVPDCPVDWQDTAYYILFK